MNLTPMDKITQTFKIFADKNRLRIVALLSVRKMCVCELAHILQVTQPSVSRHLKKMKEAGIIGDEQDGFWTNYYLIDKAPYSKDLVQCLKQCLKNDQLFRKDLKSLKTVDRNNVCKTGDMKSGTDTSFYLLRSVCPQF